ncbi:hypothetical protein [Thermovibrio ammonificans]|uniref:hypothetical protein n=1 Tax=Thermovibrio ammonificans TaxID=228745 RepID=UPI0012FC1D69|nr:hypothetical protein [Thermovibrio ammonificans]
MEQLLPMTGLTSKAVQERFGLPLPLLDFLDELEKVLKRKVLSREEYDYYRRHLFTLAIGVRETSEELAEIFEELLKKLDEKDVGREITLTEYTKSLSYSRRKAIRHFTSFLRKRFRKVAPLVIEYEVPEKLGPAVDTYGHFRLHHAPGKPYKFLIVGKIYRKDKDRAFILERERVVGEIDVEP